MVKEDAGSSEAAGRGVVDGGCSVDRHVNLVGIIAQKLEAVLSGRQRDGPCLASLVARLG